LRRRLRAAYALTSHDHGESARSASIRSNGNAHRAVAPAATGRNVGPRHFAARRPAAHRVGAHVDRHLSTFWCNHLGCARHVEAARRRILGDRHMLLANHDRSLPWDRIRVGRDVIVDSPFTLPLRRRGKRNPRRLGDGAPRAFARHADRQRAGAAARAKGCGRAGHGCIAPGSAGTRHGRRRGVSARRNGGENPNRRPIKQSLCDPTHDEVQCRKVASRSRNIIGN
jgi:hypothetical protein